MVKRLDARGLRRMIVSEVRKLREGPGGAVDDQAVDILVDAIVDAIDLTQMEDVIMELSHGGELIDADPAEIVAKILQHEHLHSAIMSIATEVTTDYGR